MELKEKKKNLRQRIKLLEKLKEEVNSKGEYFDIIIELNKLKKELKILMKIKCPKCKSTRVEVLNCGTILCKNKKCFSVNIFKKKKIQMKGGNK